MEKFIVPLSCSRVSDERGVAKRVSALLNALDDINGYVVEKGEGLKAVQAFRDEFFDRLKAEGWRVSVNKADKWQILPPK